MMTNAKTQDVRALIAQFGTRDVFEIARSNGVSIVYEAWHPMTIGEFERGTKTIRVNKRAIAGAADRRALEIIIIAHELGHFFAAQMGMDRKEEESLSHVFATALVGDRQDLM